MAPQLIVEFVLIGLLVGTYGALIGAGGGFVIVPILLLLFGFSPQEAAGTSLTVVFVGAISSTIAFVRQRRIDYQTAWRFAAATIPSALLGAQIATYFTSTAFRVLFGGLLIVLAVFLNLRPDTSQAKLSAPDSGPLPGGWVRRSLTDARGVHFAYAFNLRNGIILSVFVGFLSSILGIGGGVVHVPAMVFLFGFPAHLATATSTFVLAFTALAGAIPYLLRGDVQLGPAAALAAGVVVGAQVGAAIARRVKGKIIVRSLTIALVIVGVRLILDAFD